MPHNPTPVVYSRYGAPMGRGWPHIDDYAETIVRMYDDTPPTNNVERRHLQVARAAQNRLARGGKPVVPQTVSLQRVRLDTGGYDAGGAYWGTGQRLYCAASDCGVVDLYFRAADRDAAKAYVVARFPSARFYR